jgi:hypothetical protein
MCTWCFYLCAFQEPNIDVATSYNWNRQGNQYLSISRSANGHRWTLPNKCEIYWVQWHTQVCTFLKLDHECSTSLTLAPCGTSAARVFYAYFPYSQKIKVGLWDHHAVCESPTINYWMPEPIFMKFGVYIMAPEPISMAYFINPSHQSVCLYVYLPIVARQQIGKNVSTATNTHSKIEEFLGPSFSVWSESYRRKVDD